MIRGELWFWFHCYKTVEHEVAGTIWVSPCSRLRFHFGKCRP